MKLEQLCMEFSSGDIAVMTTMIVEVVEETKGDVMTTMMTTGMRERRAGVHFTNIVHVWSKLTDIEVKIRCQAQSTLPVATSSNLQ
jgi:hypothetical protein